MSSIKKSILSYSDRGTWGNSTYRDNVSGHVIKDLLETYKPKHFVEIFSGGGTGRDVASDFIFSHPPYWDIIKYATVRGTSDPDDLSNVMSYDEFIDRLDRVNQKIYDSLVVGGRHALLVGDVRKKVKYYSIIKDMTWLFKTLEGCAKSQNNQNWQAKIRQVVQGAAFKRVEAGTYELG